MSFFTYLFLACALDRFVDCGKHHMHTQACLGLKCDTTCTRLSFLHLTPLSAPVAFDLAQESQKLTAPEGVPRRSPTLVLTGP